MLVGVGFVAFKASNHTSDFVYDPNEQGVPYYEPKIHDTDESRPKLAEFVSDTEDWVYDLPERISDRDPCNPTEITLSDNTFAELEQRAFEEIDIWLTVVECREASTD